MVALVSQIEPRRPPAPGLYLGGSGAVAPGEEGLELPSLNDVEEEAMRSAIACDFAVSTFPSWDVELCDREYGALSAQLPHPL